MVLQDNRSRLFLIEFKEELKDVRISYRMKVYWIERGPNAIMKGEMNQKLLGEEKQVKLNKSTKDTIKI